MIEVGSKAPSFKLKDQHGKVFDLDKMKGKKVVIYFYPKDDTPGCTKEACGFRDLWSQYEKLDVIVAGVSPDDGESHQQFIEKFNLPFTLLSDTDKAVMTQYGAWGEKNMYGKIVVGVIRSTVVIDEQGIVLKHWRKVPKAQTHPDKVIEFIESLG